MTQAKRMERFPAVVAGLRAKFAQAGDFSSQPQSVGDFLTDNHYM